MDPARGGILNGQMVAGEIQNAFSELYAPDGRKMFVIALEWGFGLAKVARANSIASKPENEDHTAMLLTHACLPVNSARNSGRRVGTDSDGQEP